MRLEKIITLANERVELYFRAMERSLRATGCDLPLWVIPFDEHRFALPPNAKWWENDEFFAWLGKFPMWPDSHKYVCLLEANFQFVDTDVIFLRNPAEVLAPYAGFVTSCGHWSNPGHCVTPESERILRRRTTRWQAYVFNSGQFACDRALFHSMAELRAKLESPELRPICLDFPYHGQPGYNVLVAESGVPMTNLMLPPSPMESTWAGDYHGDYASFWQPPERQPYFIHWAGGKPNGLRPIDELFARNLTPAERALWHSRVAARLPPNLRERARAVVRAARRAWRGEIF
jgi:hypothetical protein